MIVDSNDFGQVILGKSKDIILEDKILEQIIRDNPAGQGKQTTPLILIRQEVWAIYSYILLLYKNASYNSQP